MNRESAALRLKIDQLRKDSIGLETKVFERRMQLISEAGRLDSLLLIATAIMNTVAAKQAKVHESAANRPEQTKLDDVEKKKLQLEERIALLKTEITAVAADRDRDKTASVFAMKKADQLRAPLAAAAANAQSSLSAKINERNSLASIDEMIRLDSAITAAKNNLNSAIEKNALHKKGAGKLVEQYEADVSSLMGQLDDLRRKNQRAALFAATLATAATTKDKRGYAARYLTSLNSEIATLTARRDRAQRELDDFDGMHSSPEKSWNRRQGQLDSIISAKARLMTALTGRRDSLDRQRAMLQNMVQGFGAAAHAAIRKADSAAISSKKNRSDLAIERGRVRGDSARNESALTLGRVRLRAELAKANAQLSAIGGKIAGAREPRGPAVMKHRGDEDREKGTDRSHAARGAERDASTPATFGAAETSQKIMEGIYSLLDSGKIDEAINEFAAKRSFLLTNVNFEAFRTLQYAVDQAVMSRKNHARRR